MTITHYKNQRNLWLGVVGSIVLFAVCALIASRQTITGLELVVFRSINNLSPDFRLPFLIVTQAGSEWMLFGLTLLLLGLKHARLALRLFGCGMAAFVLSQLAKALIGRPRPFYILTNVQVREFFRTDSGFPSSHTAVATACALVLFMVLPKRWRWIVPVWVLLVAVSRIYLGVHAPLDVVGGFAIGIFVVCCSFLIPGKLKGVRKITGLKLQG